MEWPCAKPVATFKGLGTAVSDHAESGGGEAGRSSTHKLTCRAQQFSLQCVIPTDARYFLFDRSKRS